MPLVMWQAVLTPEEAYRLPPEEFEEIIRLLAEYYRQLLEEHLE